MTNVDLRGVLLGLAVLWAPLAGAGQASRTGGGRELRSERWVAVLGGAGPGEVSHDGQVLFGRGQLIGYAPGWTGTRFTMDGADVSVKEAAATWRNAEPGNQEAALSLTFEKDTARLDLSTTVTAAGPSEFSIRMDPAAVGASAEQLFMWADDSVRVLPLTASFEQFSGFRELRFEQARRTVVLRCSAGFQLQDRRTHGVGLFLVKIIGSSGATPRTVEDFIEITVREAEPERTAGRTVLLKQRPMETSGVQVGNPGFESEEPFAGWTKNPLAGLDREQVHSGACSARLTIEREPENGAHVYLIQSVPVEEKALYRASAWVRTSDVIKKTVAGKSPTGGTVIVEFADKDGKWFASGDYADGLYGTQSWRRVETDSVAVPDGAGYAIIYLSLRGYGTAWFDDVTLERVQYNPVLLDPLAGASVADNTPALNWVLPHRTSAIVELCRDETFPQGSVVTSSPVLTPPFQVEDPLAPGRWYWRVRVPDFGVVSAPWPFLQTASLDTDTTDPTVAPCHRMVRSSDETAVVTFGDNVGVTRVELVVDGSAVAGEVDVARGTASCAPPRGWTPGLHTLDVKVWDAAGNTARRRQFITHCRSVPTIRWLRDGGVQFGTDRRILCGMYGVREEDMPEIAAGGFDFVHNYRWDGSGTDEEAVAYLDEAGRHGLMAFIGFSRRHLMDGDEDFVAARVGALMGHPALLAWYLYDEPDLEHQYVSPTSLCRHYHLIKRLDPFHPVVVTCAHDAAVPRYRDALDVHWTQVYGATSFVSRRLDLHRSRLNPGTPLAAILHCYDRAQTAVLRGGGEADIDEFRPDGPWMRANAFMAIVHGSSGLLWWWWGQGSPDFLTVSKAPKAWASLRRTVADVKSLEPLLTADGETRTWVETPADGVEVHLWEKRLAGRGALIAVNRDTEACRIRVVPEWMRGDGTATVWFEDRKIPMHDGAFEDAFGPREVHVYELGVRR